MSEPIRVTPDNFERAETDLMFAAMLKDSGGVGRLYHHRAPAPLDIAVIRPNRDTLYSAGVFDLDAGPVTVTLPDAGRRFMSLQLIDEEQYCPAVFYGTGAHTLTREAIGGRYVMVGIRTLVDPNDPADLAAVHALQDAIRIEQSAPGVFEPRSFDPQSQGKVREALLRLGETLPDTHHTFGPRDAVDPVRHLVGTAMAWGGNPEADALYIPVVPARNDGKTIHRLTVPKDVPVDGFWSISVYDADGHFRKNDRDAYTLNDITARRDASGSVTIQFGGQPADAPNVLPIMEGWNYLVRLYRPRPEVLEGSWRFPEAQAA